MADNKMTSLLGKPGQSFGELAGAYLSGTGKKKNRARNVLLGSLFFNAAEASRQSRVADRLRSQEIENAALEAKLASQFQTQMDLIERDQEIKSKTKGVYFKPQAEEAFNAALESGKLESLFGPNGGLENGNELKRKWMASWIDENPYADHQAQMTNIDVKTAPRTLEAFSAEAKDYMYKRGKQIASPQNVSLVHKALGMVGIGKSDAEYNKEVVESKKILDDKQAKINNFYKYDVGENQKSKVILNVDQETVTASYIKEEFQKAIGSDVPELEQQFLRDVRADGMTMSDLKANLTEYALDTRSKEFEALEEDLNLKVARSYGYATYEQLQDGVAAGEVSGAAVKRLRNENRLASFGLTKDKQSAAIEAAEGWVEVLAEDNPEKQQELMNNFFDQIEKSQFISTDEKMLRDATESIFKVSLNTIQEDITKFRSGLDPAMENIVFSQDFLDTSRTKLIEELNEGGPQGKQILAELEAVNFNIASDLDEDSVAYRILSNAYGKQYFGLRRKTAQAMATSFENNATSFLSTKQLLGQPKFTDSLKLQEELKEDFLDTL
jgi:hypothetical protein